MCGCPLLPLSIHPSIHQILFFYLSIYLCIYLSNADELCSGKANGRMLGVKFYTHRNQKDHLCALTYKSGLKEYFPTLQNKCKISTIIFLPMIEEKSS